MRRAAFTLMELMVVLVLIGIMTAMILPEMKGTFEDALLRSSARKLVDVFSLTSSQAISRNQLHRVRLEPGTGRYLVERRRVEKGQEEFIPLPDLAGSQGELDSRIAIEILKPSENPAEAPREAGAAGLGSERSVAETTFSFYPDGTADAGGILLRDRQGFELALRLNPTTGHVRIIEVEHE